MIDVVIVEDQPDLAAALRETIEFDGSAAVVGVCHTLGESMDVIATRQPTVIVSDFRLPDGDSADAMPAWLASSPRSKILVISAWTDQRSIARARQAGASAYLEKGPQLDALPEAIAELMDAEGRHARHVTRPRSAAPIGGGIGSTAELLGELASGATTTEIAERFSTTEREVRRYLNSLRRIHGVRTRAELAMHVPKVGS